MHAPHPQSALSDGRRLLEAPGATLGLPRLGSLAAAALLACATVRDAVADPPPIADARVETYKTVGDATLDLWIFEPAGAAGDRRPAIVFFFGGGWKGGTPRQFDPQCRHLAARGMVAITADYRVESRQHAKPVDCVADARSAVRWVRANADRLGIDADRIAAAGGSAGGHIAACTAFIAEFDDPGEDAGVSARPDALVLFNPALVLAPLPDLELAADWFGARVPVDRLGTEPNRLSPAHHVARGGPPTIILHGRADALVPIVTAEAFARRMKEVGNRCELVGYDDQPHGFFNREPWRKRTLEDATTFLESLGWLAAEPADAPTAKPVPPGSDRDGLVPAIPLSR